MLTTEKKKREESTATIHRVCNKSRENIFNGRHLMPLLLLPWLVTALHCKLTHLKLFRKGWCWQQKAMWCPVMWSVRASMYVLIFYFTLFYSMGVSPKQMTVHYVQRSKEDIRFHETGITDCCEPPYRGWEMYPGPLEGQPGLLTSESLLQFHVYFAFV